MLAASIEPLFDQKFYRPRIDRQVPHRRSEEIVLFACDGMQDMFDRDVVLVTLFRLTEGRFQNTSAALAEFVFVCVYICHISIITAGKYDADARDFRSPENIIAFQKVRGEEIKFSPAIPNDR